LAPEGGRWKVEGDRPQSVEPTVDFSGLITRAVSDVVISGGGLAHDQDLWIGWRLRGDLAKDRIWGTVAADGLITQRYPPREE
jgi:hypothetical protein